MARRIEISKLLAPCLLILVALQLFEPKTSVSAESNLRDVYADYFQIEDGDFTEMDYFDERLDASDIDRHGSKHRRFKLRNKHKKKKFSYGAPSQYDPANYYQSPTPHKRPLDGKYGVLKTQSIVTPPKYRAPHHPPTRHQAAIPVASRTPGSRHPVSRPLVHRQPASHPHVSIPHASLPHASLPHASHPHASHPHASHPHASRHPASHHPPPQSATLRPTQSRPTLSRPTPSRPSTPRPTPSRPATTSPKPSRPATSSPKPSRSTPSSQTFSNFELSLLPLSHPVLFGPEGLRLQTSRPKVSQSPTYGSSSSQSKTSRSPTKRSSTSRPSTSLTPASYPPTSTTLAPSTTVYSSPTSSTTTSSSTYSSTPTYSSSESNAPTYIPTTTIATESRSPASSTPKTKKSQSKKKSSDSSLSKPENGPIKLTQEIPIEPVDIPKATSLSSASVSNKDDTGFFFRPTNSFPNFFKQLLQG